MKKEPNVKTLNSSRLFLVCMVTFNNAPKQFLTTHTKKAVVIIYRQQMNNVYCPGDGFAGHVGMPFSTYDRDNDNLDDGSCSLDYGGGGGWWYNDCLNSNPNGKYYDDFGFHPDGVIWNSRDRGYRSWRRITMYIKPLYG